MGSGSEAEQVKVNAEVKVNEGRTPPRLRLTPVKVNALALTEAELELRPVLPADEADEVVEPELRVPLEDRPDSSEVRRGEVR